MLFLVSLCINKSEDLNTHFLSDVTLDRNETALDMLFDLNQIASRLISGRLFIIEEYTYIKYMKNSLPYSRIYLVF